MNEQTILEEYGLSNAETKIYLALIELGSSLAGPVIKKTNLHRGTTYQILQRLQEKGLVSTIIKDKKQHFQAVNPNQLLRNLKEKQRNIQSIIPILQSKIQMSKEKQEVTVYSGKKGIKTILEKMLEEIGSGKYYDFGVSGLFKELMGAYWDEWQKQKQKQKIKSFVIFNENLKKTNPQLLKKYYGEAKFHPKEYTSMTDTIIYKNTVILFIWTAKPPIAVCIENKQNAESYKNQFLLLWKSAKN